VSCQLYTWHGTCGFKAPRGMVPRVLGATSLKKNPKKKKIIKTFYTTEHKSFEHFFVQFLFWSKLTIPKYKTKTCICPSNK
jgi:hypothetical protein